MTGAADRRARLGATHVTTGRAPETIARSARHAGRVARFAIVILVLLGGSGAAVAAQRELVHEADKQEELLAERSATLAEAMVQEVLAGLSGGRALADEDGEVAEDSFIAFTGAVATEAPVSSISFAPTVDRGERAEFEAATGTPIVDRPDGAPAAERASYHPIRWVETDDGSVGPPVGLDIAVSPNLRAPARSARDTGRVVLSEPIDIPDRNRPVVFVIQAVYRAGTPSDADVDGRRAAHAGYLIAVVPGDRLLGTVLSQLDDRVDLAVRDGDETLVASSDFGSGGSTSSFQVAGRTWTVTVVDRRGLASAAPWWIFVATLAVAATIAALGRRTARHEEDTARYVRQGDRIAALARSLAGAGGVAEVARVIDAEVPEAIGAAAVTLGLVDWQARRIEQFFGPGAGSRMLAERQAVVEIDDRIPVARCVREKVPLVLDRIDDWRVESPPEVADDVERTGFGTTVCWPIRDPDDRVVATLSASWARERAVDELQLSGLATIAELVEHTLERARLSDAVQRDAERSARLADLAQAATAAGTTKQLAEMLASRAAEVVGGTGAHMALLDEDGTALRVVHHSGVPPDLARRYAVVKVDDPVPLAAAFATGEPVLLGDPDAIAERVSIPADQLVESGLCAAAALPIVDNSGSPFGALAITWRTPQTFDAPLVATLRTVVDLCATSLTRAWLTDENAARTAALATLARHLSVARTLDEVSETIWTHAAAALDAQAAVVGLVEGDRFRMRVPTTPHGDIAAPYTDLPLDDDFPPLEALRRGAPVTFITPDELPAHDVVRALTDVGIRAGACIPLTTADRRPLGVLSVLWEDPPALDEPLIERLNTVADLAEQTAERARLFDAEHRITQDLQHRVLSPIPQLEQVAIAARYEPATSGVGMGGDWYDTVVLDDERICVVLGDVVGHGIDAIAEMTQIRAVVRTLALAGTPLPEIVARTSAQLRAEGGSYATLFVATIDIARGDLAYVSAGHPPPLLRRPDGTVEILRQGRHPVLGVDLGTRSAGCTDLPVDSTLVAYTDGLIERPGTAIDRAVDELAAQLAGMPMLPPEALADRLLRLHPTDEGHVDDLALVVAHRLSAATPAAVPG